MEEKSVAFPSELKEYFLNFDSESENINNKISSLEKEIEDINKKIETNELTLKEKVSQIDSKRKEVNIKLHGISGDYNEDDLLSAADLLKSLKEEKDTTQKELEEEYNTLKENLSNSETSRDKTVEVSNKIENLRKIAEKDMLEVYNSFKLKTDAINSAIEVCDNDNLVKALDEETSSMKDTLENMSKKNNEELEDILNLIDFGTKKASFDKISFDKKVEEDKVVEEQKKLEDKKIIETDEKAEIEIPEPKFSKIKEEKIEEPAKEELENEIVMPTVTKEEIEDSKREVISKVDAHDKAELVKNSVTVRKSIEKYFSSTLED